MFSRIALRIARMALVHSPYHRPLESLHAEPLAFHLGSSRRPVRRRRRAREARSLLETVFVRARELVPEASQALKARSLADTTVAVC
jgi:hypothetical protein